MQNLRKNNESVCFDKVDHVIFDLDGTLVNSEVIYDRINTEILQKFGKSFTQHHKLQVLGKSEKDSAVYLVKALNLDITEEEYLHLYNAKEEEIFPTLIEMQPGVEKLIFHLSSHNIPMAIGTSATHRSYQIKLSNFNELLKHIHHFVCSTDICVRNAKPAPDIYLETARRFELQPNPNRCLVFEDSHFGVQAAQAAGMQTIWIPEAKVDRNLAEPTLTIDSILKFRPEMFGLPPYP